MVNCVGYYDHVASPSDSDGPKSTNDSSGYVVGDCPSAVTVGWSIEVSGGEVSSVCHGGDEPMASFHG